MNQDRYVKEVLKAINCSRKDRYKIREDLKSDIELSLANNETWEEIEDRLGSPKELATELNENFDFPIKSNSKRNLFIGIMIGVIIIIIVAICMFNYFIPKNSSITQSKVFDENTLNEKAQVVINYINNDNYDKLMNISDELLQKSITHEELNEAINMLGDLGNFKSITRTYFVEVKDKGEIMAVGEVVALYENTSVTYTITFDKDMKLIGLYMK